MNIQLGDKGINWTDATWNPITGCLHGCKYCYAREFADRFGRSFEPQFHPELLGDPIKRKTPTKIFVGSNADVFGKWVEREWIDAILETVRKCPQHTFQFLTKNPARLQEFNPWPANCWVGGTVDERSRLKPTLDALYRAKAQVRFISFEPLNADMGIPFMAGSVEWIIIGAQTGRHAHQPKAEWISDLIKAAKSAMVSVWFKDNLIWSPRLNEWPRATQAQYQMF